MVSNGLFKGRKNVGEMPYMENCGGNAGGAIN
jgi:hypothetical protein